mmetsp:Transcript_59553/g.126158  ORF Transcript_59553/g.126158 Transcript_59553/m.126158 type:complete len:200 (+) Transcript_59553:324-923(+)
MKTWTRRAPQQTRARRKRKAKRGRGRGRRAKQRGGIAQAPSVGGVSQNTPLLLPPHSPAAASKAPHPQPPKVMSLFRASRRPSPSVVDAASAKARVKSRAFATITTAIFTSICTRRTMASIIIIPRRSAARAKARAKAKATAKKELPKPIWIGRIRPTTSNSSSTRARRAKRILRKMKKRRRPPSTASTASTASTVLML